MHRKRKNMNRLNKGIKDQDSDSLFNKNKNPEQNSRPMKKYLILGILCLILVGSVVMAVEVKKNSNSINGENAANTARQESPIGKYTILKKYKRPTDRYYYTQGLLFKDSNTLIESTGLYGESNIQFLEFPSFKVLKQVSLGREFFGEGCDLITNDKNDEYIYQLTWQNRKVMVYNAETLAKNSTLALPSQIQEGWGLTHSHITDESGAKKTVLYVSDGTSNIYTVDPASWTVIKTTPIVDENGFPQEQINELEMYKGKLFANVYLSPYIVAIDLPTGKVQKRYDMTGIKDEVFSSPEFRSNYFNEGHCLNGIAYDEATDRFLITGKKWAYVYEIKIEDQF